MKALIRDATDTVPGAIAGRIRFTGDLEDMESQIAVFIDVAVKAHTAIPEAAERVRAAALAALKFNTTLKLAELSVRVTDVFMPREKDSE